MEFNTKFNLGDKVYQINSYVKPEIVACDACNGRGKIEVNGNSFTCNKCYGHGSDTVYPKAKWHIMDQVGKIGKVEVEAYGKEWVSDSNKEYRERYMLDITGVGSGSLYDGNDLFKTIEEAEAACNERNAVID